MASFENVNIPWPGWKAIREIGEGGYGKVYEIERTQHGITENDALKIIRIPKSQQQYDELAYRMSAEDNDAVNEVFIEQKDKLIEEIRAMQKLKANDNIVGIKDWSVEKLEDGYSWEIYIRMDILTPLIQYLKGKALDEGGIIRLGEDICRALIQCEKENIVHRDIKPDNIMVSPGGKFMLTDFGIARYLEDETTMTGIGSKPYMAPEVANYLKSDKTVDIYSLGLVMYEMLNNNRPPFVKAEGKYSALEREAAIQRRIRGEELPEPANGSEGLKRIVLKACSPASSGRYSSAEKMLEELENLEEMMQAETREIIQQVTNHMEDTESIEFVVSADFGSDSSTLREKPMGIISLVKRRKKPLLAACIGLVIIIGFFISYRFYNADLNRKYKAFKTTATENGWEVDEIKYKNHNWAKSYATKAIEGEESAYILVDFFSEEEDYYDYEVTSIKENVDNTGYSNLAVYKDAYMNDEELEIEAFKDRMTVESMVSTKEERIEVYALLEELGILTSGDNEGHFQDETEEFFNGWNCAVYELGTPVSNIESMDIGIKLDNVEGDSSGTYRLMSRSEEGEWDYYWTVELEKDDEIYIDGYTLDEGQTVEALTLVPESANPESLSVGFSIYYLNNMSSGAE